jgi:antitoxin PrlF
MILYPVGMKATMSERGQIVIPKPLRDRLGLGPGQVLECWEEKGRLIAAKVSTVDPVASVYGILQLDGSTDDLITSMRGASGVATAARRRRSAAPAKGRR